MAECFDTKLDINGIVFPAQYKILIRSPFFEKLLSGRSKRNEVIKIDCCEKEEEIYIYQTLLTLYGTNIMIDNDNVLQFLKHACFFEMDKLSQQCVTFLIENLNDKTVFLYYEISHMYGGAKALKSACQFYINEHISRPEFSKNIPTMMIERLRTLLDTTDFWFEREYQKYEFAKSLWTCAGLPINQFSTKNNSQKHELSKDQPREMWMKDIAIKWMNSIKFHMLNDAEISNVISDGFLNIESIQKIFDMKKVSFEYSQQVLPVEIPLYFYKEVNYDGKNLIKSKKPLDKYFGCTWHIRFIRSKDEASIGLIYKSEEKNLKKLNITYRMKTINGLNNDWTVIQNRNVQSNSQTTDNNDIKISLKTWSENHLVEKGNGELRLKIIVEIIKIQPYQETMKKLTSPSKSRKDTKKETKKYKNRESSSEDESDKSYDQSDISSDEIY